MLTLPFRPFAEILVGVNFLQTELFLFKSVVYRGGEKIMVLIS